MSQNVTPKRHSFGGSLPYAFTEQGVAMLSSVLTSERAVQVNIAIMRAFVKLAAHRDLIRKLEELEKKFQGHDAQIQIIFKALRQLIATPGPDSIPPRRRIGFHVPDDK